MSFKDHFSGHSSDYVKYRPTYPKSLYKYITDQVTNKGVVWDCATGNGQAAVALAAYFDKVIATDASSAQIGQAIEHSRVEYRTAPAENPGLKKGSVDLITVAQALHWFEFDAFYDQVRNVATEEASIAVWSYGIFKTGSNEIDDMVLRFYDETIGKYWPKERIYTDEEYRTIPFPFKKIETPDFSMEITHTLDSVINYINTWSAVKKYLKENSNDPTIELRSQLNPLWKGEIKVKTPIYLLMGKVH